MVKKFVNELQTGDVVVFEDGNLQSVKLTQKGGDRSTLVKFANGKVMITGHTAQYPVVSTKVDTKLSIEDVYNLVLDDNMSLLEFTTWVQTQ